MIVKIYGLPFSNTVRTVRIVAEEKGVDYEHIPCPPHDGVLSGLSPLGKIPAMDHDGFCLSESSAIARYIDNNFDGPALMPSDPNERAKIEQWVAIITTGLDMTIIRNYATEYLFNKDANGNVDRSLIDRQIAKIARQVAMMAEVVELGFVASPTLTLADCHFFPILAAIRFFPESRTEYEKYPSLVAYFDRMKIRDSVINTTPPRD